MRRTHVVRGGLLSLAAALAVTTSAPSQRNAVPTTFVGRVAAVSRMREDDVQRVLGALGPVVRDALANGETIELPGMGTFRVVRVAEHKDLVNGRPATIPASNTVEFLAGGDLAGAANAPGARPAETVPAFEYNPLPGQTRGLKTGSTRAPSIRVR